MALLTTNKISHDVQVTPTPDNCDAAGDTFSNDGRTILRFDNAHVGNTYEVTIASQVPDNFGVTNNVVFSVAPSTVKYVGPFNPNRFNLSGLTYITYDVTPTTMTVEVLRAEDPG